MPTYNFIDDETHEVFSDFMSFSEKDEFLAAHPTIRQLPPNQVNIVAGVSGISYRGDDGFKENLQRIAEAHPTSPLAKQYGDKGIKESKTRNAIDKWRKATGRT